MCWPGCRESTDRWLSTRPPGRHRRLRRFYAQFLRPGDLAFDVGAHVGNRVRAWRSLGARVVAIERWPTSSGCWESLFGRDPDVVVLP